MSCGTASWSHFILFVVSLCTTEGKKIVYPGMLESRSGDGIKVLKISNDITLNLRKSSVFAEEFLIHTTKGGEPIAYHMLGAEVEKNLYDDIEQMATVDVSEEDGVRVEGVLGDTLRIKPLEGRERSLSGEIPHELYEISNTKEDHRRRDDYTISNTTVEGLVPESRMNWYKAPRLPLLITPELHVVVDHFICKGLKFIEKKIARYVAIMTAAANLRYRSIIQPRVQLVVVGVTVTRTPQEEPYMVHVEGYRATRNILQEETRVKFREHAMKQTYFARADIVFLLSGLNLSEWENGILEHWIGGSAYLSGVCTQYKVGISEERVGSFYGVHVYAHEIAHSLGCQHDGDGADSWVYGNIGSADCKWNDGYMMSYKYVKPNMYRFSPCCQREITNVYNRPEYRCLLVRNSLTTVIRSSKLPGDVSSRQTYCEKVYNQYSYVVVDRSYNPELCTVRCFVGRQGDNWLITAVDGVRCGKGKVCVLGNCTSKAELKAE
uniref:Putative tick salivary metalloprotease n=1 Tax=Rhipicephalus pulchellus TaxID=72859 RepID=L7LTL6_RHIPC